MYLVSSYHISHENFSRLYQGYFVLQETSTGYGSNLGFGPVLVIGLSFIFLFIVQLFKI